MTDIFDEVEENIRQERFAQLFKRYGLLALLVVVLVLAGVGGWQAYEYWQRQQAASFGEELDAGTELLAKNDLAGAEAKFTALIAKASPGYKAAALMERAGARVAQGDNENALKDLDEAVKVAPEPTMKDLARLKAALVAADFQDFKTLEPRLTKMIEDAGPFQFQARELLGMEALEAGEPEKAREQFDFLTLALEAPEGVRERAGVALAVIGPKPQAATAEPADAPAAPAAGEKKP